MQRGLVGQQHFMQRLAGGDGQRQQFVHALEVVRHPLLDAARAADKGFIGIDHETAAD